MPSEPEPPPALHLRAAIRQVIGRIILRKCVWVCASVEVSTPLSVWQIRGHCHKMSLLPQQINGSTAFKERLEWLLGTLRPHAVEKSSQRHSYPFMRIPSIYHPMHKCNIIYSSQWDKCLHRLMAKLNASTAITCCSPCIQSAQQVPRGAVEMLWVVDRIALTCSAL